MSQWNSGIEELHHAWRGAISRGDMEGALELLTPDYVLWAPSSPPVVGREPVRSMLSAALAQFEIHPGFEAEEQIVAGDLAFQRGWDIQTIQPRKGGAPTIQRQRVFLILRRGKDGRWRFARGMSQPGPEAT